MRRHASLPPLALLALLVALLLRAGIPAGYMLASADGLPHIVPCPGSAPAMPHHHGGPHGERADVPCAFALVTPPALPGTPLMVAPPAAAAALVAPAAAETAAPRLRAVLRPPATGPPSA
jgi:hypothetical protein